MLLLFLQPEASDIDIKNICTEENLIQTFKEHEQALYKASFGQNAVSEILKVC